MLKILLILSLVALLGLVIGYLFSLFLWKKKQKALFTEAANLSCGCSVPCSPDCEEPILYQISEPEQTK